MNLEVLDLLNSPELEGEITLGVPEDFATLLLSDVLADFIHLHPRIAVRVECDLTLNLLERFKKREFDIVMVKMACPKEFEHGKRLWEEPLEWVGHPSLLEKEGDIPLVLSPSPCVNRAIALESLEKAGSSYQIRFSSPSYAGIIAAVKAGMGITVLPRPFIPKELAVIKHPLLPTLKGTHASLLKKSDNNPLINSFEDFVLKRVNAKDSV